MNILYLTQFFSGTGGGASLIFYDLAKSLSERGHKVFVICNVATETIDNDNFKLHLVKPFSVNTSELPSSPSHNLRYIMNSIVTGIKIARRNKIDIIHTNSFTPVIAGSIISKLIGAPVVASIFDVFTTSDKSHWNNWIHYNALPSYYSTIGRIYEKISLSVPLDFIHTISNATKNDILMHRKNKPVQVVYPSIDPRKYPGAAAPTYGNFILYIGRLVFYKNVDILIRAYKEVVELIPSAKLVIVGDGPMKNEWKSLSRDMGIENNIIFTDHISHDEKVNLLKSCRALALPSVFEGFGLVLLEAFALAKPVLVSNVPPLDEIVEDGIDGFIIAHDDPNAWTRKVVELLNNRDLSENMGVKAAEKFRYKFCFPRYIDAMENLYRQLLRQN